MPKLRVTTPKGELQWVFISGEGSFNELSDKYEYKATLRLPIESPEAIAFKQKLIDLWENSEEKKAYDEAFAKAKPAMQAKFEIHPGYTIVEDDNGNPTGFIDFKFKTNTEFETKKGAQATKIDVYNAQAKKVDIGDTKIGNGSIGKIAGTAITWQRADGGGVSLYLSSIQIIKLVEYVDNEFGEEEDGDFVDADGTSNEFTGTPSSEVQDDVDSEGV